MMLPGISWFTSRARRVLARVRLEVPDSSRRRWVLAPAPVDPQVLAIAAITLRHMLEDVESIEADLPPHEQPVSAAARGLIQRSLAECRKPRADVVRLAADMQRVGEIAVAMRARILLAPLDRKPTLMN